MGRYNKYQTKQSHKDAQTAHTIVAWLTIMKDNPRLRIASQSDKARSQVLFTITNKIPKINLRNTQKQLILGVNSQMYAFVRD